MKILVLNGSPKGQYSITLQTVRYLAKRYPSHTFTELHVGQRIRALEKDFAPAAAALEEAELILFSYPVYTFLATSQLHRFIELWKAAGLSTAGTFAAQISTSKHFYDITAHRYIRDNCGDLGLRYLGGLSADMEDLTAETGRLQAEAFFEELLWRAEQGVVDPLPLAEAAADPVLASVPAAGEKTRSERVVILTDSAGGNASLARMIERFSAVLPCETEVVDLASFPFAAGCLGCFRCAADGVCVHKDGFDRYLRENIQSAQAIITAFAVRDHSMGARFKLYDDRQFCNGHRTVTMGMPMGYLVSGALEREENLRTLIEARAEVGGNVLCGIASDEHDPDAAIDRLAARLVYAFDHPTPLPQNFYGVGGMKIFRDLIWQMQGLMRADHRFYKSHGQYDFPQQHRGKMLAMYLVGSLMANEKLRSKMGNRMNEGMVAPYKKVADNAVPKER